MATDYRSVNPQELVPTLVHDGHAIGQSLAIIEYLDEIKPEPPLLPRDALGRARVRGLAYMIACDIHPLNNLRVLLFIKNRYGLDEPVRAEWQRHWIAQGFAALETLLANAPETRAYCHGEYAHARRYLPRAADGECAARRARSRALSHAHPHRSPCARPSGLRGRASEEPARCGVTVDTSILTASCPTGCRC